MSIKKIIKKIFYNISGTSCNQNHTISTDIPEITPIGAAKSTFSAKRINLFLPSLNKDHVFGGISTAINFYLGLQSKLPKDYGYRIIITDAAPENIINDFDNYKNTALSIDSHEQFQLIFANNRYSKVLPIGKNDIFIATAWWTAYSAKELIRIQNYFFNYSYPLLYIIQDFEPGFYQWSSRYALAESTYKNDINTIAIINSKELYNYIKTKGYSFYKAYYFLPKLNQYLKKNMIEHSEHCRKNIILIYGRPSVARNAFEIIVNALKFFSINYNKKINWEFISLGEKHSDIDLGNGNFLISKGKVSLDEYSKYLYTSKIGISLMISPHPSYPPLEMAYFGIKTITNSFENKNLSYMHRNIISLDNITPNTIGEELLKLSDIETLIDTEDTKHEVSYIDNTEQFNFIDKIISDLYENQSI